MRSLILNRVCLLSLTASEGSEINPAEMPMFSLTRKQLLFYKVSKQRVTHDFLPMLINL